MFSVLAIDVPPRRAFVASSTIRNWSMFYFTSSIKSEPVLAQLNSSCLQKKECELADRTNPLKLDRSRT
jgi:hypothetical protein